MLGNYIDLMSQIKNNGYSFIFFDELINRKKQIILRHDVDFDCESALSMAKKEFKLDIKSTYFFMIKNPIYNIFSHENEKIVKQIRDMGHTVSVHFDHEVGNLQKEIMLFDNFFDVRTKIISIHRPNFNKIFDLDFEHTYLKKYFIDIEYISDSTGQFKYGHPIDSKSYINGLSIHLLIHPEWWIIDGESPIQIIQKVINKNTKMNQIFFQQNSKPYKEFIN